VRDRIRHIQEDREDGFTLIELLIVIVVLGILAGIVVFGISTFRNDSQTAACKASLTTVNVAADAYEAKVGTYPTAMTQLLATASAPGYLKAAPPAEHGPYFFVGGSHTVTSGACTV
jgi:prepilin-type N-terminal cleavage/methylation domain-containing protein